MDGDAVHKVRSGEKEGIEPVCWGDHLQKVNKILLHLFFLVIFFIQHGFGNHG
jgi:hypothetical protein